MLCVLELCALVCAGPVVRLCSVRLDRADFARQHRRHREGALRSSRPRGLRSSPSLTLPFSFTPPHAPKCSCMRLNNAPLRFSCSRCARLRFPGSRCVHLLCYCTFLYCSNVVCFSLVLLYLLVLSCTCMAMLISDIPSSIPWEYSLYTSVGSLWDLEAE